MRKLIVILSFLFFQTAMAYEFTSDFDNGYFWQELPLDFHISEFDSDKQEALKELVSSAAQVWESGVGNKIWEFDKDISGRNIIRWATDFEKETGFDPDTTLAVTIRHNRTPYWAKAEIILNPEKQFLMFNIESLKYVLMHELGHTMGLDHTDDQNSVMKASYTGDVKSLSNDDIDGMLQVLDIMETRRANPQVLAAQSEESSSNALSCGTVDLGGGSGPGGPLQFIFSLLLGMGIMFLSSKRRLFPI